jgi:hypothetical protein
MAGSDNKKLDLLLSLRNLMQNETTVIQNNSVNIDSFFINDHDIESINIYYQLHNYVKMRYERDKVERDKIMHDINNLIDQTCDHEFVDDEIEHIYSGNLTKIRYCCICEKTS